MKYLILLTAIVLLAACTPTVQVTNTDDGNFEAVITKDGQSATIKGVAQNSDSWCQEGTVSEIQTPQGVTITEVKGIVSSGDKKGLCHTQQRTTLANGEISQVDVWADEAGNTGYMQTTVNGQTNEIKIG